MKIEMLGQSTPPQPKITAMLTILSPKPEVTPLSRVRGRLWSGSPLSRWPSTCGSARSSGDRISLPDGQLHL